MTEENSSGMEKLEKDITAVWLINTQQMYEDRILGHRGCCLAAQSCPTLATPWAGATRVLCPWDFPGRSTGVGCHCLLQRNSRYVEVNMNPYYKSMWPQH